MHCHVAVSLFAAKTDLVKIFKYGNPKLKEAIAYILKKTAACIRKKE